MLTEPLNASIISMYTVNEAPPSRRTIIGVFIVLAGCAIVLWESNRDAKDLIEDEETLDSMELQEEDGYGATQDRRAKLMKQKSIVDRRRRSSVVLFSQFGKFAPDVAAKASYLDFVGDNKNKSRRHGRLSLPAEMFHNNEHMRSMIQSARNLQRAFTFHSSDVEDREREVSFA